MKKVDLEKLINEEIDCLKIDELRTLSLYHTIAGEKRLELHFKSCLPLDTSIQSSYVIGIESHPQIVEEIKIITQKYFNSYVMLMNSNKILPNWH